MTEFEYGEETFRGYRLLEEMIYGMLATGETECRLPKTNIPLDYSVFPFEIVRIDKVIKVLNMVSEDTDDRRRRYFDIVDQNSGQAHRFSFSESEDGKHLLFRLEQS